MRLSLGLRVVILSILTIACEFNQFDEAKPIASEPADLDRFAEIGLMEPANIHRLAEALCGIERAVAPIALQNEVNRALRRGLLTEMPPPLVVFDETLKPFAEFVYREWTIKIRGGDFDHAEFDASLKELVRRLAHELRHADQFYFAARYQAAQGTPVSDNVAYLELPLNVVEPAARQPTSDGTLEYDLGRLFYGWRANDRSRRLTRSYTGKLLAMHRGSPTYGGLYQRYLNDVWPEGDAVNAERPIVDAVAECLL